MIRLIPLVVVVTVALVSAGAGFCWGALWRRAPHTWTSRMARRVAGLPGAPDLADTLTTRLGQADQIAAVQAPELDAVDQHMATVIRDDAAGLVAAALAPDSIEAQTAALIRQAEAHLRREAGDVTDTPSIPGEQS